MYFLIINCLISAGLVSGLYTLVKERQKLRIKEIELGITDLENKQPLYKIDPSIKNIKENVIPKLQF